jgi:hypothetical protein
LPAAISAPQIGSEKTTPNSTPGVKLRFLFEC